jgi:hypothetical protein
MAGAILAGWDHVEGVELMEDHVKIAQARLAYWHQRRGEFGGKPVTVKAAKQPAAQNLSLFDMPEEAA